MKSFEIKEINEFLKGKLIGYTTEFITEPEQIESAKKNSITFIGHKKYLPLWEKSKASAAIIDISLSPQEPGENRAFIEVQNADLAMAKLLELFNPEPSQFSVGIHSSATVIESADIHKTATIGAHCYIGANVKIGANAIIYPNATILDNAIIGNSSVIKSAVTISERCIIGDNCTIHSNVSIGTDGFGYRPSSDGRGIVKIPHIGNVVIGNNVEIGSGTCIDRGKFSSTLIGEGTKIDNLVQIGHNCKIGRFCLISGCCGISGSVTIGDGVIMAGQVGIKDHVNIGHKVTIGARSVVINDIPSGKTVLGYPAVDARETLKLWAILKRMTQKATSNEMS